MPPEFTDVEIFAGAGGRAIGLYVAGFTDAFIYEVDTHSCETLSHNICSQTPTLSRVVHQVDVTGLRDFRWRRLRVPVRLLAAGVFGIGMTLRYSVRRKLLGVALGTRDVFTR